MKVRHLSRRRLACVGALTLGAALVAAGVALASDAVKSGSYIGHYKGGMTEAISFKVSANGKKVTDLSVETPFKCQGGCGGVESPSGGTASISKKGKFKVKLEIKAPGGSTTSVGTDTVVGTFESGGTAKGTVTSHFDAGSAGETVAWTATS